MNGPVNDVSNEVYKMPVGMVSVRRLNIFTMPPTRLLCQELELLSTTTLSRNIKLVSPSQNESPQHPRHQSRTSQPPQFFPPNQPFNLFPPSNPDASSNDPGSCHEQFELSAAFSNDSQFCLEYPRYYAEPSNRSRSDSMTSSPWTGCREHYLMSNHY